MASSCRSSASPCCSRRALTILDVPQDFVRALTSVTHDPLALIFVMLAIFIIAGMFMETTPNIVILAPLLYPVAQQIGMDQIHFCIFMVTSLGLGFITPPMGLNLFVVASLTGQPIMTIARYAFPFVVVMVLVSALIGFVPPISLWAVR